MFRAFSNRKSASDKDNVQDEEAKLPQPTNLGPDTMKGI